ELGRIDLEREPERLRRWHRDQQLAGREHKQRFVAAVHEAHADALSRQLDFRCQRTAQPRTRGRRQKPPAPWWNVPELVAPGNVQVCAAIEHADRNSGSRHYLFPEGTPDSEDFMATFPGATGRS